VNNAEQGRCPEPPPAALWFGHPAFFGSWIRCQTPLPAAFGELDRSAEELSRKP
jgi:hypothetical protein